jgi:mycoredoxin
MRDGVHRGQWKIRSSGLVEEGMVTMYSTTWCGYCRRLKLLMDQAGIECRVVDIERDPEAAAFVESVNGGNQTVPVIRFPDGSTATNPSIAQVQAQLAPAA